MAPEVANAVPGIFSFINYEKADVWSCGTMAYEIFGMIMGQSPKNSRLKIHCATGIAALILVGAAAQHGILSKNWENSKPCLVLTYSDCKPRPGFEKPGFGF